MRYLIFLAVLLFSSTSLAQVKVVDGDSLEINRRRIRLEGIDAPEYGQMCQNAQGEEYNCGETSTAYLVKLIGEKKVRCEMLKKDIYKRELSICYAGDLNLNKEMVLSGQAVAYDYNQKIFVQEEIEAKKAKKGIWQGKFMKPELYRRLRKDD